MLESKKMVTGWRMAFCTSIPKDRNTKVLIEKQQQQQQHCNNSSNQPSPKISSKFGFFSNPSTPRLQSQSQPVSSSPGLRCRTTAPSTTTTTTTTNTPTSSLPNSPKLQCNISATTNPKKISRYSPRLLFQFQRSNPSSPKSPSSFSLLKSTLRLSKSRCGICLQSVKSGQGTAIFTAECSHSFHFGCIATHVKKNQLLLCPVCNTTWKELPLISVHNNSNNKQQTQPQVPISSPKKPRDVKTKTLRVYNDDEPLSSPTSGSRFNPIPEENDDENDAVEFQGFFVNTSSKPPSSRNSTDRNVKNVEVSLLPESAVVAVGRSYETYAVVIKIKAPQPIASETASLQRRAPIDLVTVVDVSASNAKIQMMKRAMRLIVSSLRDADRLSVVAFSSTSKRLLPLRRMTSVGRRSARRIVDALCGVGNGMCVNDALKKAAKVLQDRRERNTVASIMLLSEGSQDANQKRSTSPVVSSTCFPHLDIPVHTVGLGDGGDDALAKCLGGLLSVVVQDLSLQLGVVSGSAPAEIAAVYSLTGRPAALGSGSIRLGDLYAGEERELLVELKASASTSTATGGPHSPQNVMSVRSTHRDPSSNELVCSKERVLLVPRSQTVRSASSNPNIERLRNLHVAARAVAESRRFVERSSDFSGAYHLLSSARSLLLQTSSASAEEFLRGLEGEMAELERRRQVQLQAEVEAKQSKRGGANNGHLEEKQEPLTPTSAWRAAERLAKVATIRKSLNRVSDLHGFENARF